MRGTMNLKQQQTAHMREKLISAAIETLRGAGVLSLTLDNVAKHAGVSKGGLLHHFPNKEALITALFEYISETFAAQVLAYAAAEPEGTPGRWLRAYIRATFAEEPPPLELIVMIAASMTESATLFAAIRAEHITWENRLSADGLPVTRATVIRQATDSFWMERLLKLDHDHPERRAALLAELIQLTEVGK